MEGLLFSAFQVPKRMLRKTEVKVAEIWITWRTDRSFRFSQKLDIVADAKAALNNEVGSYL